MKTWCKIVERNNRQYLLLHEFDNEDELDKIVVKTDLGEENEDIGIVAFSIVAKEDYTFTDEEVREIFNNPDSLIVPFEKQIADLLR